MREYLVFCRGRPSKFEGWKRLDALARIVRGALAKRRPVHLLFEDATLVSFTPEFLGSGPWGNPQKDTCELRFGDFLAELLEGKRLHGATMHLPKGSYRRDLHAYRRDLNDAICGVLVDSSSPRFDLALLLCEGGCRLRFQCGAGGHEEEELSGGFARTLIILGGVRDIQPHEEQLLHRLCDHHGVLYHSVSLGTAPELTSKCIKTVEVAADLGLWDTSVSQAVREGWRPSSSPLPSLSEKSAPFLHIVLMLNTPLETFMSCPAAAGVVMDTFIGSHQLYRQAALSLIGKDTMTVTMRHQPNTKFPSVLFQSDALAYINAQTRVCSSLEEVLLAQQKVNGQVNLRKLMLIHAASDAPPLRVSSEAPASACQSVAVVFAPCGVSDEIQQVGCRSGQYVKVAINSFLAGPAFVRMTHNEGLLMRIVPITQETRSGSGLEKSIDAGRISPEESDKKLETESCASTAVESDAVEMPAAICTSPETDVQLAMMRWGRKFRKKLARVLGLQATQSSGIPLKREEEEILLSEDGLRGVLDEIASIQDRIDQSNPAGNMLPGDFLLVLDSRMKRYERKAKKIQATEERREACDVLNGSQNDWIVSATQCQVVLAELVSMQAGFAKSAERD